MNYFFLSNAKLDFDKCPTLDPIDFHYMDTKRGDISRNVFLCVHTSLKQHVNDDRILIFWLKIPLNMLI